ncbi:hypothetical protein ACFL4L_07855, partial [bacterium]
MIRTRSHLTLIVKLVIILCTIRLNAMHSENRTVHVNLSLGIAYPQIPLSQFRPPIGITSHLGVQWRIHNKWSIYASGNGLKTFSLGTVTGNSATLKFNMLWSGGNLQYVLSNDFTKINFISLGIGWYKLNRQLDKDIDKIQTSGICLGFVNLTSHKKRASILEIRWHLLFKP